MLYQGVTVCKKNFTALKKNIKICLDKKLSKTVNVCLASTELICPAT